MIFNEYENFLRTFIKTLTFKPFFKSTCALTESGKVFGSFDKAKNAGKLYLESEFDDAAAMDAANDAPEALVNDAPLGDVDETNEYYDSWYCWESGSSIGTECRLCKNWVTYDWMREPEWWCLLTWMDCHYCAKNWFPYCFPLDFRADCLESNYFNP